MAKEDIQFTFDPTPIVAGLNEIVKKLGNMESGFVKTNKTITEGFKTQTTNFTNLGTMAKKAGAGMKMAFVKVLAIIGVIRGAIAGVTGALSSMPEVGQGLSIMKDIFMRNFLWPLRQQILPLLMNLLKWFRENRPVFVKWGQIFVNIIKIVIRLGKILLNTLGNVIGKAMKRIKALFFSGINSIEDFMNILIFKIAAITEFLAILLEPFSKLIGDILAEIVKFGERIGKTFMDAFKDIDIQPLQKAFDKLWKSIQKLWKYLKPIVQAAIDVYFETLGNILRETVVPAVQLYIKYVKSAATALTFLIDKVKPFFDMLGSAIKTITDNPAFRTFMSFVETLAGLVSAGFKGVGGLFDKAASMMKVDDAIITKKGDVVIPDKNDDIIVGKGLVDKKEGMLASERFLRPPVSKGTTNVNANFDFSGMTLTVTEGNAAQAGKDFATNLIDEFAASLDRTLEMQGV